MLTSIPVDAVAPKKRRCDAVHPIVKADAPPEPVRRRIRRALAQRTNRLVSLAEAVDDVAAGPFPETAIVYLSFLKARVDEALAAALPRT